MSEQYPGGFITKSPPVPDGTTATGIWNLSQQAAYQAAGTWPPVPPADAQFNYVTMLLHGDGTNGAQNNTFLDSSTNNFTITRNGNTTQGSFSPYGSNWSNYFDGSSSIKAADNAALRIGSSDFTVECWYYNTVASGDVLWSKAANGSAYTGWYLNIQGSSRTPVFYATANGSSWAVSLSSSILMTVNTWNHVAVTRNGNVWTIWVNGVSGGSTTVSATVLDDGSPFTVGGLANGGSANGYVSNLRFVKGTAVYTSSFTPPTAPLTAVTNTVLLTCQSNRFLDNSSNAFALTTTGTPSVQRFNPFGTSTAYSTATIGGSGYFDGTGDYLSVADNAALEMGSSDFTIESWIYLNGSGISTIFSKAASAGDVNELELYTYNKTVQFYVSVTAGTWLFSVSTADVLEYKTWNHVAVTRSGSSWNIWVNGVSAWSGTGSGTITNTTTAFAIGAFPDNSFNLAGYMADFRVVKGTAVYTSTFTPPTSPLTAVANTQLLCNMQNAAIYDNAMMNDLETVGNAQISTSVKKYGTGSLAFENNSGTYLSVANTPNLRFGTGNFTVEFWVYQTSLTGYQTVYSLGYSSAGAFSIQSDSGNGRWIVYISGSVIATESGTTVSTNTWYHIAVVRSGSTVTIYRNGTSVASGTSSGDINYSAANLTIGSASTYPLIGYIDDLRITKGYARYTTTFTPPTTAFPNVGPN